MSGTHALYEFGDFALDVGQQRLTRRDTGEAIPLTTKVFDTLVCLVERPGETLDKEFLLRSVWPGVIVEENSLTQNVSTLRQILGETRGENRYIATIARRGYRFVAKVTRREEAAVPVTQLSSVAEPNPAGVTGKREIPWRTLTALAVLAILTTLIAWLQRPAAPGPIVAASSQTLAILPFRPLLPAERNESLELGMAESLISNLGRYSPQAISPLSSVRRYAALNQDAIAAGRELRVDTVLDGSLQRRGDRLRVSVRLLRVSDGRQLWAQSFDQDFTSIFDVQDVISARVAQALSVRWLGDGATRGAPYTQDPEAYALYASGRFAWTRQNEPGLVAAVDFFERAIARDPQYALAYAGLADSYAVMGVFGIRAPHEVFPKARQAVERALSIDPDLAAAHSALGHIKVQFEHDWDGAAKEYARAVELDPALALTYHRIARLYGMQGDIERGLAASQRAQQLEPLWLWPRVGEGDLLYYARRYDECIRQLEQVLVLDDRADNARSSLIRGLLAKADYGRALVEIEKRPIQAPGSHALRAQALALSGHRAEANAELDRVLAQSREHYVSPYEIAMIYASLADTNNAFLWLGRAMEDRSTLVNFLAQEPTFDALHADPRFAALVQQLGIYHRVLPAIPR
jgi:DNA-binding winged helix-turn-helix (wHTH) protein/TolB-like protein/Tfp pilus assembly protein PilF